ncbi:MAG: hypothetical protein JW936_08260, partial [Sedimentisphaerales bacterium]|nr:hypothetical protein [Sedimentisphaerales bacterium]
MFVKYSGVISQMMIVILLCAAGCAVGQEASQDVQRFQQDRFAIGFWVDPPYDQRFEQRYAEIAEANFTLVVGGFGPRNGEQISHQIRLCEQYDLNVIITPPVNPTAELEELMDNSPAFWGQLFRDEPGVDEFADLAVRVQAYRETNPGKLAYINLYPNYASPAQWDVSSYHEYLERFVQEVNADVLSMDHYPLMTPDVDRREAYCQNLAIMREVSLAQGIPFWNFFNTMPFANHYDPTE